MSRPAPDEFEHQLLHRRDGTGFTLRLAAGAAPDAPMVLIEPAMGVQGGYYGPLARALAEAGYNVGIAELRGHEERGGAATGLGLRLRICRGCA